MDSDAHPRDTMARSADLPASPDEIKAVRIKRYASIGHNSFIMKGVTVGEGSIIGVNSVVLNDIPDYSVAIGNPARVIVKNINRTTGAAAAASAASEARNGKPASRNWFEGARLQPCRKGGHFRSRAGFSPQERA